MSDTEQREWCARLGKTPEMQAKVIRELLRYANGDEMTAADREICRRQLQRLDDERKGMS